MKKSLLKMLTNKAQKLAAKRVAELEARKAEGNITEDEERQLENIRSASTFVENQRRSLGF